MILRKCCYGGHILADITLGGNIIHQIRDIAVRTFESLGEGEIAAASASVKLDRRGISDRKGGGRERIYYIGKFKKPSRTSW